MGWGQILGTVIGAMYGPAGMAIGAAIGGGAENLLGGKDSEAGAIKSADQAQASAADRAINLQRDMFNAQVRLQEPFRQAGVSAVNKLVPLATQYTPFGAKQFQAEPGYQFRLGEGIKALERSAAARGGLLSGATLKGIQQYGQGLASQEYENAFNRYQTERINQLNPLLSMAGYGQTAAGQMGTAGRQYGVSAGNIYTQQGTNEANALLAQQKARSSAYGDIGTAIGKYFGYGS